MIVNTIGLAIPSFDLKWLTCSPDGDTFVLLAGINLIYLSN
jgi:hypothetical protein